MVAPDLNRAGPGAVQPQNPTLSNRNAKRWIIETLGVERWTFALIPKAASSRRTPKRLRRGIQPLHFRFRCDLMILH